VRREVLPREEMLRFVLDPQRELVFDVSEKLPGRGMWVSATPEALDEAVAKRLFVKAAKGAVKMPDNLPGLICERLKARTLELLGLCRKAGLAILGVENVKKVLGKEKLVLGFEASDAQTPLFRKDEFPVCRLLSREELGHITTFSDPVYVAIKQGKLAEELTKTVLKLNGMCKEST